MAKIGIIDDWVNPKWLDRKRKIRHIFVREEDEKKNWDKNLLTYATTIAKILERETKEFEIINFVLALQMNEAIHIQLLKRALELCQKEEINILCMSLGTVQLSERNDIYPLLRRAYEEDVILIAAADNAGNYILPAAFDEVIGVDAIMEEGDSCKYYQCGKNLWNIDFKVKFCFPIRMRDKYFYPSASFAVPVIAAKVNDLLNQGIKGQKKIRQQLEKKAAGYLEMKGEGKQGGKERILPIVGSCDLDENEWSILTDFMQIHSGYEVLGVDVDGKIKDGYFLKSSEQNRKKWEDIICWAEEYTIADIIFISALKKNKSFDLWIEKTQEGKCRCIVPETGKEIYIESLEKVYLWILSALS